MVARLRRENLKARSFTLALQFMRALADERGRERGVEGFAGLCADHGMVLL
jgi:hypothetical protein